MHTAACRSLSSRARRRRLPGSSKPPAGCGAEEDESPRHPVYLWPAAVSRPCVTGSRNSVRRELLDNLPQRRAYYRKECFNWGYSSRAHSVAAELLTAKEEVPQAGGPLQAFAHQRHFATACWVLIMALTFLCRPPFRWSTAAKSCSALAGEESRRAPWPGARAVYDEAFTASRPTARMRTGGLHSQTDRTQLATMHAVRSAARPPAPQAAPRVKQRCHCLSSDEGGGGTVAAGRAQARGPPPALTRVPRARTSLHINPLSAELLVAPAAPAWDRCAPHDSNSNSFGRRPSLKKNNT